MEWSVDSGAGFGSAIRISAAGAVSNGYWRRSLAPQQTRRSGAQLGKEGLIPRLGGGAWRRGNVTGAVMADRMGHYVERPDRMERLHH